MKKFSGVSELRMKSVFHFFANFQRTLLDSRPNRGMNIFRTRAKFQPHHADAFFHDALYCPAPSGMKRAHSFLLCVDQQDREAIGGENAERHAGEISDQAIAHQPIRLARANNMNNIGMNLSHRDQRPWLAFVGGAGGDEHCLAIALHGGAEIVFGEANVQRSSAIAGGKAAGACRESMDKPRNTF